MWQKLHYTTITASTHLSYLPCSSVANLLSSLSMDDLASLIDLLFSSAKLISSLEVIDAFSNFSFQRLAFMSLTIYIVRHCNLYITFNMWLTVVWCALFCTLNLHCSQFTRCPLGLHRLYFKVCLKIEEKKKADILLRIKDCNSK